MPVGKYSGPSNFRPFNSTHRWAQTPHGASRGFVLRQQRSNGFLLLPSLSQYRTRCSTNFWPVHHRGSPRLHVWNRLRGEPGFPQMQFPEFQHRLIEGNAAGRLTLQRADLGQLADPEDMRSSETNYLNATFHLIVLPPEAS